MHPCICGQHVDNRGHGVAPATHSSNNSNSTSINMNDNLEITGDMLDDVATDNTTEPVRTYTNSFTFFEHHGSHYWSNADMYALFKWDYNKEPFINDKGQINRNQPIRDDWQDYCHGPFTSYGDSVKHFNNNN